MERHAAEAATFRGKINGQEGGDDNDDEDVGGSTSGGGANVSYIQSEGPVLPAVSTSDRATLMCERKLILSLDLDHTLLTSTSRAKQDKGFTPDTFKQNFSDLAMLTKLRPFVRGFLK